MAAPVVVRRPDRIGHQPPHCPAGVKQRYLIAGRTCVFGTRPLRVLPVRALPDEHAITHDGRGALECVRCGGDRAAANDQIENCHLGVLVSKRSRDFTLSMISTCGEGGSPSSGGL